MTLGELRTLLANCEDKTATVRIHSPVTCSPARIESWRGSYNEAAIVPETWNPDGEMTVSGLIDLIDEAYTKTHVGYKGGDYTFTPDTRVWLAQHGSSGNCSIERVKDDRWCVFLIVGWDDF